jgi:hypothetical protein
VPAIPNVDLISLLPDEKAAADVCGDGNRHAEPLFEAFGRKSIGMASRPHIESRNFPRPEKISPALVAFDVRPWHFAPKSLGLSAACALP